MTSESIISIVYCFLVKRQVKSSQNIVNNKANLGQNLIIWQNINAYFVSLERLVCNRIAKEEQVLITRC